MPNKNAPAPKGEGVVYLPGSDTDAYSTHAARHQFLTSRFGLSFNRAALVAPLLFGEAAHV